MQFEPHEICSSDDLSMVLSRTNRAREYDTNVRSLVSTIKQQWYNLARNLHPIWSEQLYRELGFASWTHYTREVFNEPVQTINNFVMPYRNLLQSGVDPARVCDVPMAHINELAAIARANGGNLSDEIIELAKASRSRQGSIAYREVLDAERDRLGIESPREVRVQCEQSLHNLWLAAIKIIAKREKSTEPHSKHASMLLEQMLMEFIISPEALKYSTRDEIIGLLENLKLPEEDGPVLCEAEFVDPSDLRTLHE